MGDTFLSRRRRNSDLTIHSFPRFLFPAFFSSFSACQTPDSGRIRISDGSDPVSNAPTLFDPSVFQCKTRQELEHGTKFTEKNGKYNPNQFVFLFSSPAP